MDYTSIAPSWVPLGAPLIHPFTHTLIHQRVVLICSRVFSLACSNQEGLASAEKALRALSLDPSAQDCAATRRVCQIVSTRAAHLCAAALAAVLRQIRDNKAAEKLRTTIGADGSVYKNHQE